MNTKIAILMKKYVLEDNFFIFRLITPIYGSETSKNTFKTKDGREFFNAENFAFLTSEEENCYYYVIDEEDLKDRYADDDLELCTELFFEELNQSLQLGILNNTTNKIEIQNIPVSKIKHFFQNYKYTHQNNQPIVQLNEEKLDLLLNTSSLEEMKKLLEEFKHNLESFEKLKEKTNVETVEINQQGKLTKIEAKTTSIKQRTTPTIISSDSQRLDIDIEEMESYVKERIFGQDEAIESLATTIAMNYRTSNPREIKKTLIIGPTGCGKTEIISTFAEYLGIPYTNYSSPDLSAAGYVGKDIEDVLKKVYENSGYNKKNAENSILYLDEFDKIARETSGTSQEVNAQPSLLKLLEGHTYNVEIRPKEFINLNTNLMTIICGGAFEDLEKEKRKKIGYQETNEKTHQLYKYTTEELIKYGIMPEVIGRLTKKNYLKALTPEDKKNILLYSKISPLLLEIARLEREFQVTTTIDDSYIQEVIQISEELKTGARSLQETVAYSFEKIERELVKKRNQGQYSQLLISGETVKNNKVYILKK